MNVVLIGDYSDTVRYSDMLNNSHDLIKIDGSIVLSQNNIKVGKGSDGTLFETVFNTLMLKHMEVMAFHQLKTGFVFTEYPRCKAQLLTIERKYETKIDLIIDLSKGKLIDDLDESDVPIVTIDTSKDSQEVGDDIRKATVRSFMKKFISI